MISTLILMIGTLILMLLIGIGLMVQRFEKLEKKDTDQQRQIDELKHELEEMKQKGE
jgi:uncharacterized membrane-anchored protein YhcB (DUF1043 family)